MKLRFTPRAAQELDDILTYIEERSPQGALRVKRRIRSIVRLIAERPGIGSPSTRLNLRRIAATPIHFSFFTSIPPIA